LCVRTMSEECREGDVVRRREGASWVRNAKQGEGRTLRGGEKTTRSGSARAIPRAEAVSVLSAFAWPTDPRCHTVA
jgi:hypothetical protein